VTSCFLSTLSLRDYTTHTVSVERERERERESERERERERVDRALHYL